MSGQGKEWRNRQDVELKAEGFSLVLLQDDGGSYALRLLKRGDPDTFVTPPLPITRQHLERLSQTLERPVPWLTPERPAAPSPPQRPAYDDGFRTKRQERGQ